MSSRFIGYAIPSIVVAVALIASNGTAMAAKKQKMSYEEAFAKCKSELGGGGLGSEGLNTAGRYSAGGACMKKYGYRLKK